ncbi:MAG: VWA domain-containing protein [Limnohabitans sp.]
MPDFSSIHFLWPPLLVALALLPLLLWVYLRRRPHAASSADTLRAALSGHLPFVLLLMGMGGLVLAMARPQAVMLTPVREATVVLAIDASGSMRAGDVQPSRIDVARAEALRFIEAKPGRLRVGLVTMAGTAALVQAPTERRDDLIRALEQLPLQYGSALGSGVLIALETLLPAAGIDAQKIINDASNGPPRNRAEAQALPSPGRTPSASAPAASATDGRAMAIVLFTDGQGNIGPDLQEMAQLAAQYRVRIYTVGVGTPEGAIVQVQGRSMRVRLEEEPLRQVARTTGGEYFRAASAQDLQQVYNQLGHRFRFEKREVTEITGIVGAVGMLLVSLGCLLAVQRHGRIV